MIKYLITAVALSSMPALANTQSTIPDIVQLTGPYSVSVEQALNSHVNLYVTKGSTALVGIDGGDTFLEAEDNSSSLHTSISENKSSVYIKNSLNANTKKSVAINTRCGLSVSVTINSLDPEVATAEIKPKLQIHSPNCGSGK